MAKMRWPKRVGSLEGTYGVNWRQGSKAPILVSPCTQDLEDKESLFYFYTQRKQSNSQSTNISIHSKHVSL